jgi:hypothetical protein
VKTLKEKLKLNDLILIRVMVASLLLVFAATVLLPLAMIPPDQIPDNCRLDVLGPPQTWLLGICLFFVVALAALIFFTTRKFAIDPDLKRKLGEYMRMEVYSDFFEIARKKRKDVV